MRRQNAKNLIIVFHGGIDTTKRSLPVFGDVTHLIGTESHHLAIADPSISKRRPCPAAWFSGHEGFAAQTILTEFFAAFGRALGVSRKIYFGTSSGGFASLLYSFFDPGSCAVAFNPQTKLTKYHAPVVDLYRTTCWPSLNSNAELSSKIVEDVGALYETGFKNTVVYVNSLGDRPHFENQLPEFVSAMAKAPDRSRFFLHSDYWGEMGHVLPPRAVMEAWLRAVSSDAFPDTEALLDAKRVFLEQARQQRRARVTAPAQPAPRPRTLYPPEDIAMADRLSALRRGSQGGA